MYKINLEHLKGKYQKFEAAYVFIFILSCIVATMYILIFSWMNGMQTTVLVNHFGEAWFEIPFMTTGLIMSLNYLRKNRRNYYM
jgi:hypothetical protein